MKMKAVFALAAVATASLLLSAPFDVSEAGFKTRGGGHARHFQGFRGRQMHMRHAIRSQHPVYRRLHSGRRYGQMYGKNHHKGGYNTTGVNHRGGRGNHRDYGHHEHARERGGHEREHARYEYKGHGKWEKHTERRRNEEHHEQKKFEYGYKGHGQFEKSNRHASIDHRSHQSRQSPDFNRRLKDHGFDSSQNSSSGSGGSSWADIASGLFQTILSGCNSGQIQPGYMYPVEYAGVSMQYERPQCSGTCDIDYERLADVVSTAVAIKGCKAAGKEYDEPTGMCVPLK